MFCSDGGTNLLIRRSSTKASRAKHEASMTCQGLEEMIGAAKELD